MLSAATLTRHPYNPTEEVALDLFRKRYVDLGAQLKKQREVLRDQIIRQIERISGWNGFPLVLIGQSFGAGSFGRNTLSQPLDDIDIYIVLNSGRAVISDHVTTYKLEGATPGPFNNDMALRQGFWISADLVLERVASYLAGLPTVRSTNAVPGINSKRKSAYIKFGELNMDITPVVRARFSNAIARYYMPGGDRSHIWKPTNPKEASGPTKRAEPVPAEPAAPYYSVAQMVEPEYEPRPTQRYTPRSHGREGADRLLLGRYSAGPAAGLGLPSRPAAEQLP